MRETSVTAQTSDTAHGAAPGAGEPPEAAGARDGRLTRAERTRASVVDALLTLNEQGNLRPTARDIAAEAGVSLRSLYVHFDDLEALFVAAAQRHAERLTAVLPPLVTEGTFDERLDAFLARRRAVNEIGAGVRRAALLQEPFSPTISQAMAAARQRARQEVGRCFAPEIAASGGEVGRRLIRAVDIAACSAAWESLRSHQGLSVDEAAAHVREMVLAFVRSWVPGCEGAGAQVPTLQVKAVGPRG